MFGLTSTADQEPLAKRRRDRRRITGLIVVAMTAFITLDYVGQPLAAVGTYWTFVLAAAGLLYASDHVMDERDRALERVTSHRAVMAVGAALIVLGPGLGALAEAGIYDAPPIVEGVLFGWVVVYAIWGVAYGITRLQR